MSLNPKNKQKKNQVKISFTRICKNIVKMSTNVLENKNGLGLNSGLHSYLILFSPYIFAVRSN